MPLPGPCALDYLSASPESTAELPPVDGGTTASAAPGVLFAAAALRRPGRYPRTSCSDRRQCRSSTSSLASRVRNCECDDRGATTAAGHSCGGRCPFGAPRAKRERARQRSLKRRGPKGTPPELNARAAHHTGPGAAVRQPSRFPRVTAYSSRVATRSHLVSGCRPLPPSTVPEAKRTLSQAGGLWAGFLRLGQCLWLAVPHRRRLAVPQCRRARRPAPVPTAPSGSAPTPASGIPRPR